jgi:hypothetical protein
MHAEITNPEDVTVVTLKNRKRLHVVPGSFTVVEPDSFSFTFYRGKEDECGTRTTVSRGWVAAVEFAK